MTYQIQINNSNNDDFLKIIQSLKNIGLVKSIKETGSLALEGNKLSEKDLLSILKEREEEMGKGNFLTQDELVKFLKLWKTIK